MSTVSVADESQVGLIEESFGDAYDVWEGQQTKILIIITLTAFIGPLSSTLMFPSIPEIIVDLSTNTFWVTLSVSISFLVSGTFPLFWGPLSDRYGRKRMFCIGLIIFIVGGLATSFVNSVALLVVFRGLQATGGGALIVVGTGTVADIYRPAVRGDALGWYTLSNAVSPLFGPVFGGILAQSLGWRWMFGILTMVGGLALVAVIFFLPETLRDPQKISCYSFVRPMRFLLHPPILLLALSNGIVVSTIASFLVLFPLVLENDFKLDETFTGLSYLPYGVLAFVGSKAGGKMSDVMYAHYGLGGRLVPTLYGNFITCCGLVLYAFSENFWIIMASTCLMGFGFCAQRPGVYSYSIQLRPNHSGAVSAAILFLHYWMSFVGSTVAPILFELPNGEMWLYLGTAIASFLVSIPICLLVYEGFNIHM